MQLLANNSVDTSRCLAGPAQATSTMPSKTVSTAQGALSTWSLPLLRREALSEEHVPPERIELSELRMLVLARRTGARHRPTCLFTQPPRAFPEPPRLRPRPSAARDPRAIAPSRPRSPARA